jgi:hypothetical protein
MGRDLACVLACVIGLEPAVAWAQPDRAPVKAAAQAQPPPAESTPGQGPASIDSLGVSFERIKRELRIRPPSTVSTPLKLEYYVEVQALLPPIPIFKPGELTTGPVPYGAPTHADMLDHVTPLAFKSPAIPVSSILVKGREMLGQWEANRARAERLLRERQRTNDLERERQRRLKESVVVSPPK